MTTTLIKWTMMVVEGWMTVTVRRKRVVMMKVVREVLLVAAVRAKQL